jgi:ABC-type multidrug transport system ATPase subunit
MLTGMTSPDASQSAGGTMVYGSSIFSEMDQVRMSMGVCPQHDVLFEGLSVREHIMFFAQLKGASYEAANEEAETLTTMFHLEERLDHLGNELSGGQRRKLSVAIAVCGGSRFVVLDEPTAGMDPLARRELWDLLASLRKGRTLLLTTHYMDEADVLGDRVGIMSLGQMQCMGSTQFLKSNYGAGYKLIFDKMPGMTPDQLAHLTSFVQRHIPEAKYFEEDGAEEQAQYSLPFSTVKQFGPFFTELEVKVSSLHVSNFGVTITSLEDVFLKVGEDHSVTPSLNLEYGIGTRKYESNMLSQIIALCSRKLVYAMNDFVTIPLIGIPIAANIAAAILWKMEIVSKIKLVSNLVVAAMYIGGYLGAPGLLAEFIVKERSDKLRNVLTVMGCDFRAYWIGTFLADFLIMMIPMVAMWITWGAADMTDFYVGHTPSGATGVPFLFCILFTIQIISFSYFFSNAFSTAKACISYFPILLIILLIIPNIAVSIAFQIAQAVGTQPSDTTAGKLLHYGDVWCCMFSLMHRAESHYAFTAVFYVTPLWPDVGVLCLTCFLVDLCSWHLSLGRSDRIPPRRILLRLAGLHCELLSLHHRPPQHRRVHCNHAHRVCHLPGCHVLLGHPERPLRRAAARGSQVRPRLPGWPG